MKSNLAIALSCLGLLSGCASVIEGRAQEVTIHTNPEGANCTLERNGTPLGTISTTPGTLYLEKTKDDILITCNKAGYRETRYINKSAYPKDNWIYILVGGPIGWGIDSASGADNQYASPVSLDLSNK